MSLLFVDNPVGSGFSHVRSEGGWCNDSKHCVANNLIDCTQQFFDVFPELRAGGLWVAGESYAGHYIPPFAVAASLGEGSKDVSQLGATSKMHINGLLLGDPWWEPAVQIQGYAEVALNTGLADADQAKAIKQNTDRAVELIRQGLYLDAFHYHDITIAGMVTPYPTLFRNITGDPDVFNSRRAGEPVLEKYAQLRQALQQPWLRSAIHALHAEFSNGSECVLQMLNDIMRGYRHEVEQMMQAGYPVLIYNGQDDFIVAPRLTEDVIASMHWSGREDFEKASREPWRAASDTDTVSGWIKHGGGLTHAVVRGGGHFLRADQPLRVKDIVTTWINAVNTFSKSVKHSESNEGLSQSDSLSFL